MRLLWGRITKAKQCHSKGAELLYKDENCINQNTDYTADLTVTQHFAFWFAFFFSKEMKFVSMKTWTEKSRLNSLGRNWCRTYKAPG